MKTTSDFFSDGDGKLFSFIAPACPDPECGAAMNLKGSPRPGEPLDYECAQHMNPRCVRVRVYFREEHVRPRLVEAAVE